jgi:hypothetical protein
MTIIEGNKLIAEFMGVTYYQNMEITADLVQYHSSWDWLMPVVEKIESLTNAAGVRFSTGIEGRYINYEERPYAHCCFVISNQHTVVKAAKETKIEAVWEIVIQFIEWYNQSKNTQS